MIIKNHTSRPICTCLNFFHDCSQKKFRIWLTEIDGAISSLNGLIKYCIRKYTLTYFIRKLSLTSNTFPFNVIEGLNLLICFTR